MRKFLSSIFICMCWLACSPLIGQQVYQAHHYGSPGDIYLYNRFSPTLHNDQLIQEGEQIVWDLSTQNGLATHPVTIIEPSQGISQFNFLPLCTLSGLTIEDCFGVWSTTGQAVQLIDSLQLLQFTLHDLARYQSKVSNLLLENFIGFNVNIGGSPTNAVIVYQVPDTVLRFPIEYGNEWTSTTALALDLNPAGEDITYEAIQTRLTRIDGWGTLQTPYDTFTNVIRLRSDILRIDTIVEQDTDVTVIINDQVEYMWLDTNYSLPVMTANGMVLSNDSVVINQVEYLYEEECPLPTWSVDIGGLIFYLNEQGSVDIHFNLLDPNADTYEWYFDDGQTEVTTGSVVHTYHSAGPVSAVVTGCMTNCLPLQSCAFQILDFEIVDTTTSVYHIDGTINGIKVFPNPASDLFTLSLPSHLGEWQYSMYDVNGRKIRQGVVQGGNTQIEVANTQAGLYTLSLVDLHDHPGQRYYLRLAVID